MASLPLSNSFAMTSPGLRSRGHAGRFGKAVHADRRIGADHGADRAAGALVIRVRQFGRSIPPGVERLRHADDILRADGGAQLAAFAALGVDGDPSLCHVASAIILPKAVKRETCGTII